MVAGDVTPAPGVHAGTPLPTISSGESEFLTPAANSNAENYTGELICIKVKDVLGITSSCLVHTFVYTPFATFRDLLNDVANQFQISYGDFELVYQSKTELYELSQMPPDETLSAANLLPTREKEYAITINSKKRGRRVKAARGVARKLEEAFNECSNDKTKSMESQEGMDDSTSSILDTVMVQRDFVGLKNMNMTCYLNSLLQGLWFTPEFRNLVYVYMHKPERCMKKSICVPLQKLFLRLQFSIRESIETDELTNTFGWNNRDTWHQHDIEELCNLLMENLSMEFKHTPLEGMIEALFFGLFNDYVKCLECQRRNMRDAAFLVLPLPIRQIGAALDSPTLEEALKIFTAPELLDGNNQYNCSQCEKPCDAHKGFLFKKLPYILTIQLKRFEFNWNTGRKYKLNDKVVFPMVLDMNPYMDKSTEGCSSPSDLKAELVKPSSDLNSNSPRASHSRPVITLEHLSEPEQNGNAEQETGSLQIGSPNEAIKTKLEELYRSSGPDVYQLYGVLVHRGGLTGGHYFAYIRDFESFSWYRCDDSYVRKADVEDIEISFGGDDEDKEPTSAYMLMYRRFEPEMNSLPFLFDQMPSHLQELWYSMVEVEKVAHEEEELEKNTIRISVHCRVRGTLDMMDAEMNLPKAATTSEAAFLVYKNFFPEAPEIPIDRLRLSRYDKDVGVIENSFEGKDDQYITYTLRNPLPVTKNEGLILEIREQDECFFVYSPTDLVFLAQVADYQNEDLGVSEEIHASSTETVSQLKETIALKLRLSKETLTIVLHTPAQTTEVLEMDWAILKDLELNKINCVYVQAVQPEEIHGLLTFIDNYIRTILFELDVQLPTQNGGNCNARSLPSNDIEARPEEIMSPPEKTVRTHDVEENNDVSEKSVNTNSSIVNGCIGKEDSEITASSDNLTNNLIIGLNSSNVTQVELVAHSLNTSRKYIFKVKDDRSSGQWIIRADGRMPLSVFSAHLSKMINLAESHFILYKIDKEEEIELVELTETLNSVAPFDKIRIRMGHRLQKNEGRVTVYLLDLKYPSERCPVLGEVVLNPNMTVQFAQSLVLKDCCDNVTDLSGARVRLRKRNQLTPSKVFRDGGKISDYYNYASINGAELYLQKLDNLLSLEDHCYPIMIRRWHQNSFTLDPPFEIVVFHDHSISVERVILDKLLEFIDLPENDIEVAKPNVSYPFIMNPVAIQDLTWFPLTSNAKKALYVYNDELALFVRDKTEHVKAISAEEETQLRLENEKSNHSHYTQSYGLSPPKKETGLKMNLACSPP